MKTVLAALLISSAFAGPGDVLLTCAPVPFSDLEKIEIVESDLAGQIFVVETGSDKKVSYKAHAADDLIKGELSLSDWYGYTRTLIRDGGGWSITHQDECSGGITSIKCE